MKAVIQSGYGSTDVLDLREIDRPVPGDDDVLVRVHSAALHAGDVFCMAGVLYIVRRRAVRCHPRQRGKLHPVGLPGRSSRLSTGRTR